MKRTLDPFVLEEYLAEREFSATYMFCGSDLESRSISDILDLMPEGSEREFHNLSLSYTTTEGDLALREEIAHMYDGMESDNVHCFAGAQEAIFAAAHVFLSETDHCIAITPCYQSLSSVAKSICDISTVPVQIKDGQWHIDVTNIAEKIRPNTKMLFVNFPHNPTGYIPSGKIFGEIIELAEKNDLILFSDEVYRGIELDREKRLPSACELYENAISLGVMSKSFGFAGLRVGWATSQNKTLLKKLAAFKHYLSICNSAPSEWLSTAVLKYKELIIRENNYLVKENFTAVKSYFLKNPSLFQWIEPQGGCTAFPKYLGEEHVDELADNLLKKKGVVILPDSVYEQNLQHFRISFGRKNCLEALRHFSEFFEER